MRDFKNARALLRRRCARYGCPGLGSRLLAHCDSSGTGLDALCERNESAKRRHWQLGCLIPVPGWILGANGICRQIAPAHISSDVFDPELSTESNARFNLRFILDPFVAFRWKRKRKMSDMFDEIRRRSIGTEATIHDIAAILKFSRSGLPTRFNAISVLSYVCGRSTGDKYQPNLGRHYAGFAVDGKRVMLRGFRESEYVDGPSLFFGFDDTTVCQWP